MRTNVLLEVLLVLCLILSVCRKVVELKYGSMWGGMVLQPYSRPVWYELMEDYKERLEQVH